MSWRRGRLLGEARAQLIKRINRFDAFEPDHLQQHERLGNNYADAAWALGK